jgi:hypothetical protein
MTARIALIACCCVAALVGAAHADSVPVPNFSFQNPVTPGFQDNADIAAGAPLPNMSDAWYYLGGFSAGGSPVGVETTAANGNQAGGAGTQNGYVNVGAAMGSANLTTIVANETYFLTVSVAGRFSGFNTTSGATIALAANPFGTPGDVFLADPSTWVASTHIEFSTLQTVGNAFADYQASFITGASGGPIGQQLVVVLASDDNPGLNNPIAFDNVRVDTGLPIGPGDVNGDGLVNLIDFAAIRDNFRTSVASRTQGDLNGDGLVNFDDFREWKSNYAGIAPTSLTAPEPAAGALLAAGAVALLRRRRQSRRL